MKPLLLPGILPVFALAVLSVSSCRAQSVPTPPQELQPSVFARLFPRPTGLNGYEDLVLAAEQIQYNKLVARAEGTDGGAATLSDKRRMLADPDVQQALERLHTALTKPFHSPHDNPDENTLFPEFALTRRLARVLGIAQYVYLADGQVDRAIETAEEGLRMGYLVQGGGMLISGLVGVACDAIALRPLGDHLEQCSLRDCLRIERLVETWLKTPSPMVAILQNERDTTLRMLDDMSRDTPRLMATLKDYTVPDDEGHLPELASTVQYLRDNPAAVSETVQETRRLAVQYYDQALADVKLPAWQRSDPPMPKKDTLAGQLFDAFMPSLRQVTDKYTREQAQVQMLGVHAAIHRYRWEYGRLPDSLTPLRLGELALDPFSGKPLAYKRIGDSYTLSSLGPVEYGEDGKPTGDHTTLTLTPTRK